MIVSELVEQRGGDVEDVFAALMHDAAEAYLGDMPHPIKHRSPLGAAFKAAEEHLEQAIRERFGIKDDVPEIKRADRALLATERRVFSAEQLALAGARRRRAARARAQRVAAGRGERGVRAPLRRAGRAQVAPQQRALLDRPRATRSTRRGPCRAAR